MNRIRINNIKIHAHHGCWPEEEIIGGDYVVDVWLDVDFNTSSIQDDLSKTIDYVKVSKTVHREMAIRSKLIETVCHRIHAALKREFSLAEKVWVRVTKISAPMPGQVESVSVEIEK